LIFGDSGKLCSVGVESKFQEEEEEGGGEGGTMQRAELGIAGNPAAVGITKFFLSLPKCSANRNLANFGNCNQENCTH